MYACHTQLRHRFTAIIMVCIYANTNIYAFLTIKHTCHQDIVKHSHTHLVDTLYTLTVSGF